MIKKQAIDLRFLQPFGKLVYNRVGFRRVRLLEQGKKVDSFQPNNWRVSVQSFYSNLRERFGRFLLRMFSTLSVDGFGTHQHTNS